MIHMDTVTYRMVSRHLNLSKMSKIKRSEGPWNLVLPERSMPNGFGQDEMSRTFWRGQMSPWTFWTGPNITKYQVPFYVDQMSWAFWTGPDVLQEHRMVPLTQGSFKFLFIVTPCPSGIWPLEICCFCNLSFHKGNHTAWNLPVQFPFLSTVASWFIQVVACVFHFFFFLSIIPWCGCTTVCFFNHWRISGLFAVFAY